MEVPVFYKLFDMIKEEITFKNTNYRDCIQPITRLSLTLRYACHGMYTDQMAACSM